MKLFRITFLMSICLYLVFINYNYVNAAFNISIDRSDYIKAQLDRRSASIVKEMNSVADNINDVFSSAYGGLFFGLSTISNSLSGLFGMLNFAIPCGGAALVSSAVLGVAQRCVEGSQPGDVGYTIAQGINSIIKQQISKYNIQELAAKIKYIHEIQAGFYIDGTTHGNNITANNAFNINTQYNAERSFFEIEEYQLDSVGLYALFANAHLLFLFDMVVSGASQYSFVQQDVDNFYGKFKAAVKYYRAYFDEVDVKGRAELEENARVKSNQDEWNLRNDYYNYMKLYVYDISNYWDYLDPIEFSTGVFLENAHVSLSNLFGAPYNSDKHMTSSEIDSFLLSKNIYQYQGKLTGIYYKNFNCYIIGQKNTNLVKYFGGRIYSYRDGVEKDTFFLGDTGTAYPSSELQYKSVDSLKSINQYNAHDGKPVSQSRDYHWGLSIEGFLYLGNFIQYQSNDIVQYPQKVASLAIPISYNLCKNSGCNVVDVYLVESAVMGFVNEDVSNENVVFELTSSMIDAQKYNYIYPQTGYYYSRDGYQRYKHSMYIPGYSIVTYKIQYSPFNKQPGTFKLYIDFKAATSQSTNVKVYNTQTEFECLLEVIHKVNIDATSSGIKEIGSLQLVPSYMSDNYVTIQFSRDVYFQHLVFKAIE